MKLPKPKNMRAILTVVVVNIKVKSKPIRHYLLYPLIVGFIIVYVASTPPKVNADTVDGFFSEYFTKASDVSQRQMLYHTKFTSTFREFEKWQSYKSFWAGIREAKPGQAIPTPGNPLEFAVTVTFYSVAGKPKAQTIDYFFTCNSFFGAVLARIAGCPQGDIMIDRLEWVNSAVG